jgi:hypothetical protein
MAHPRALDAVFEDIISLLYPLLKSYIMQFYVSRCGWQRYKMKRMK